MTTVMKMNVFIIQRLPCLFAILHCMHAATVQLHVTLDSFAFSRILYDVKSYV